MSVLVGVDGCPAGWIAVLRQRGNPDECRLFPRFADLLGAVGEGATIAIDMPIGLPDRVGRRGRGPEQAVRPMLGQRQSSVFSIPSRAAVYAGEYREACAIALATSDPPRKVSKQGFHLFPKIREIDALLTPGLQARVREVHPEVAFCVLNGGAPMLTPKKIRGRVNLEGIEERRELLRRFGFDADFLIRKPPRGAAADDFIDACVCCLIAGRIAEGIARPFPDPPAVDAKGLHIAIWA